MAGNKNLPVREFYYFFRVGQGGQKVKTGKKEA
jgi:hypothetical protein